MLVLGKQLLEVELAAAATRRRAGDAGDAFRVGHAFRQQLLNLLACGAAAMAKNVVVGVWFEIVHSNVLLL